MSLILQELGIVVAMQQPNPSLVTAEFLKLSGIVPLDWQLAREPINQNNISELLFTNGVRIVAEPNRIMFGENIGDRDISTLTVATIAQKYSDIFKLAKYSAAVGRVLTNWQTDLSAYCKLITDRFLSPSTPTLSVPTVADRDEDNLEPVEIPYAPNLYPTLSFS